MSHLENEKYEELVREGKEEQEYQDHLAGGEICQSGQCRYCEEAEEKKEKPKRLRKWEEQNLKAYQILQASVQQNIRNMKGRKERIEKKMGDAKIPESWKPIYKGQILELNNMIVDLQLAYDRAHYPIKFGIR